MPRASILTRTIQEDWSAGEQPDVAPHLIDERGVLKLLNGLIDEDGSIYRRGGTVNITTSGFAAALRWIWDGYLKPGRRTVFADSTDFGVIAGDGVTPLTLGGAGVTLPAPAAELRGILFLPDGAIYGGSQETADYSTGTVTTTNASAIVTGAGTTWLTNVDAGMLFRIGSERVYVVASVDSNTQITLEDAYQGTTGAGKAYTASRILDSPGAPYPAAASYSVCADRLLWAVENTIRFGTPGNPHAAWVSTHFHELPAGARVVGHFTIGQTSLVFTTAGVFAIRGLAYTNPTDPLGNPQHTVDKVSSDLILWGGAGVATWNNALVVPALDGIYLFDGVSRPTPIAHSFERHYRAHIAAGYQPGGAAVYAGHYLLPILSADGGTVVDFHVCRIDRPVSSRHQTVWPWSRFTGAGGSIGALAVRAVPGTAPALVGAATDASARVLDASGYFEPGVAVKNDADGTTHQLEVVTRDYVLSGGALGTARRVRWRYELLDAATDFPTLLLAASDGGVLEGAAEWDAFDWDEADWAPEDNTAWESVQGSAPADSGIIPYVWHVNRRARYIRFRLRSSGPSARLTLRALELFHRQAQTLRT